ncbi:MAG: hypothetical protein ACE366_15235 [Bradymonadia bacterium]
MTFKPVYILWLLSLWVCLAQCSHEASPLIVESSLQNAAHEEPGGEFIFYEPLKLPAVRWRALGKVSAHQIAELHLTDADGQVSVLPTYIDEVEGWQVVRVQPGCGVHLSRISPISGTLSFFIREEHDDSLSLVDEWSIIWWPRPEYADSDLMYASELAKAGRFEESDGLFEHIIADEQRSHLIRHWAWRLWGRALWSQGADAAGQVWEAGALWAEDRGLDRIACSRTLAAIRAYYDSGDVESVRSAQEFGERICPLEDNRFRARLILVNAYVARHNGFYRQAVEMLEQGEFLAREVADWPLWSQIVYSRARAWVVLNQFDKAESDLSLIHQKAYSLSIRGEKLLENVGAGYMMQAVMFNIEGWMIGQDVMNLNTDPGNVIHATELLINSVELFDDKGLYNLADQVRLSLIEVLVFIGELEQAKELRWTPLVGQ